MTDSDNPTPDYPTPAGQIRPEVPVEPPVAAHGPMPGDVVNGHILGTDGIWIPLPPSNPTPVAQPKGLSTGAKVGIAAGSVLGVILLVGIVGAAFGLGDDTGDTAAPEPAVTVTEDPTTPAPETSAPVDPDDEIRQSSEYALVQAFMDKAMRQSGADITFVCLQYQDNPAKYNAQFTRIATKGGLFAYDVAAVAVPDWFARECGGT